MTPLELATDVLSGANKYGELPAWQIVSVLANEVVKQNERVKLAKEALEFYADEKTYRLFEREESSQSNIDFDAGDKARAALEKLK